MAASILPVFSSLPRMQDYVKQESKYLSINGRALLDLTRGAPVILNPASEYGKELSAERGRAVAWTGAGRGEARTIVGEADYPMALVEALTARVRRPPRHRDGLDDPGHLRRPRRGAASAGRHRNGPARRDDWPSLMQAIEAAAAELPFPAWCSTCSASTAQSHRPDRRPAAGRAFLSAPRPPDPTLN